MPRAVSAQVRPRYVREAHRLLKTSIIHVEADDVVLDDDGDDDDDGHDGHHGNAPRASGTASGADDDDDDEFPLHTKGLDALPTEATGDAAVTAAGEGEQPPEASAAAAPTQRRQVVISNEKFKVRAPHFDSRGIALWERKGPRPHAFCSVPFRRSRR